MFLIAVPLLLIASVPLAGGRLGRLESVRIRAWWVPVAALAVQVAITTVLRHESPSVLEAANVLTYALAGGFAVANRHIPGVLLAGVGGALNFTAMTANGWIMPASERALRAAGMPLVREEFANSTMVSAPRLAFLGDVFSIPESWPLSNVFSVGDILLFAAGAYTLHRVCESRLVPTRWRADAGAAAVPVASDAGVLHPGADVLVLVPDGARARTLVAALPSGITVDRAADADDLVVARDEFAPPGRLAVDVSWPGAIDAIALVREWPRWDGIPILAFGAADSGDAAAARGAGADVAVEERLGLVAVAQVLAAGAGVDVVTA